MHIAASGRKATSRAGRSLSRLARARPGQWRLGQLWDYKTVNAALAAEGAALCLEVALAVIEDTLIGAISPDFLNALISSA